MMGRRGRRPAPSPHGEQRAEGVIESVARVDRRTKNLTKRIAPGEIAVIDHDDLDRVSAESLVECGVAAVVNAGRSISPRYPNDGPLIVASAGIPIVDAVGSDIMLLVRDGDVVRIDEGTVLTEDGRVLAQGTRLGLDEIKRSLEAAAEGIGETLEHFVGNTMEYMRREADLLLRGVGVPEIRTPLQGRHVLVVVRGHDYKQDLEALRGYIADMRPAIIAVDGAADALLEDGFRPDLIVGDMDSVSTAALTCGAEILVHAYPDGRAPGLERVEALGLDAGIFRSAGMSQDIALLLAYERGAELIVAVGMQTNLVEFLDKGRAGMSSTFLVRLRVGTRLVDAKGVNRLYRTQVRTRDLVLLVVAALTAMLVVVSVSEPLRLFFRSIPDWLGDLWFDIKQIFG